MDMQQAFAPKQDGAKNRKMHRAKPMKFSTYQYPVTVTVNEFSGAAEVPPPPPQADKSANKNVVRIILSVFNRGIETFVEIDTTP